MNRFDIEWELCDALDHAVPDVKDEILKRCAEEPFTEDRFVPMDLDNRPRRRKSHWQSYAAAAAILILMVNIGVGLVKDRAQNRIETIIGLDVNPSIELAVNAQDRVIDVTAVNAEAGYVLDGMELVGSSTDVAVNAILGSMYKQGYLGASSNSILVSVDNKDEEASRQIETRLIEDINETLQAYSLDAAILSQTVKQVDETVTQTATDYELSQGRTLLIQKIIDNNPDYTFEELSQLTINELTLLLSSQTVEVQTVTIVGAADESSYIGQEAAVETVLSQVAVDRENLKDLYTDIGVQNARMVYNVSYLYEGVIYIYKVDALTAEIVASYVDYPVMEVSPTTDITQPQVNGESDAGKEGQEDAETAASDMAVSDNQGSESGMVSGNGTVSGNAAVSGNESSEADDPDTDGKEETESTTNGSQRPAVSDNSVSSDSVSENTASGNEANSDSEDEIKDTDDLMEGKYSQLFMRRSGIPRGAKVLWMDGKEEFGGYEDSWITLTKAHTAALAHAQITQGGVNYTFMAVYEQEGKPRLILEFETRTAAYQYILDASDGTIVEYEKRLL